MLNLGATRLIPVASKTIAPKIPPYVSVNLENQSAGVVQVTVLEEYYIYSIITLCLQVKIY